MSVLNQWREVSECLDCKHRKLCKYRDAHHTASMHWSKSRDVCMHFEPEEGNEDEGSS
jgi:hypothetical protein